MTATSPPAYTQGGTYSASLDRLHQFTADALPHQSLTFAVREGCFPGRMPAFTNPSAFNVTIGPCSGFVTNDSAASVGDYKWCNPSNAALVLTGSSSTLNRIDLIGLQVKDNFLDSSGLNSATVIVVQGTAVSGTASPPATPNSFIPLVQASVPALSTNPTLSLLASRTGGQGMLLPVLNATERAAISSPYDGQAIWRIDRQWVEVFSVAAAGWLVQGTAICSSVADRDAVLTTPLNGQLATTTDTGTLWIRKSGVWTVCPSQPKTQVVEIATTSMPNATFTAISFTSEDFDDLNNHDNLTNPTRFTCSRAGKYELSGGVGFAVNGTGSRGCQWAVNGTAITKGQAMYASSGALVITDIAAKTVTVQLGVGDFVELQGWQNSGGALNTAGSGSACSYMSVRYVSE